MNFNKVISPSNNSDFDKYYYFRWKYLRKDLNQKLGSERDDAENISIHRMIKNNNDTTLVHVRCLITLLLLSKRHTRVEES